MNIHVCLVSDQLTPNVIPALYEKPERAILLASEEMQVKAKQLQEIFSSRGIKTGIVRIAAYNFSEVVRVCKTIIESEPDALLTLNVTGGTKIAALAAFQEFYMESKRVVYMDTANQRLLEMGDEPKEIEMSGNMLKVKEYLACYGKSFAPGSKGQPPAGEKERRPHTAQLCRLLVAKPELLKALNREVEKHKESKKPYFNLPFNLLPEGGGKLCGLLLESGVASQGPGESVNVNGKDNLFYVGGGWLEEFVYGAVAECGLPGLDLCMNVNLEWRSAGKKTTRNELDVAFCYGNRLNIISCKTSNLDRKEVDSAKGKEALYELDSISDKIGGLFARPMLVSAHRLSSVSLQRASDLGIKVVSGHDVPGLGKYLQSGWLKP